MTSVDDIVIVRSDPPAARWLSVGVVNRVRLLVGVMSHLRIEATDIGPGVREIVLSDDLATTVRSLHGEALGDEVLSDFDTSRLGGVVVGKTLFRSEDFSESVIVMDSAVFRADDAIAQVGQIFLLGHELAHALIGQLRRADGGPPMPPSFLPWETGRWLTRYALEEYKADRIAQFLLGAMGTATVDGVVRPLRSTDFRVGQREWVLAAGDSVASIARRIHSYRCHELDLMAMWNTVQPMASDLLITLAHAQAEADEVDADGNDSVVTEVLRSEAPPLHRLWTHFAGLAREWQVLQPAATFRVHEANILDRGRDALLEFWADLGLTFRPEGESFYLSVAAPHLTWQPVDL